MKRNSLSIELLKNMIEKPSIQMLKKHNLDVSLYEENRENLYKFDKEKRELDDITGLVLGGVLGIFLLFISFAIPILCFVIVIYLISVFIEFIRRPKKIKQIDEQIKEVEKLKSNISERLEPFEKQIRDYYNKRIKDYFQNNLYYKKSSSNQFEESLSEFALMIKESSTINSCLATTHIPLYEYETYLAKRQANYSPTTLKDSLKLNSDGNVIKTQEKKNKEVIPPEKVYRTARKIDNWEEINRKRKLTGLKGEEIAVVIEKEYLESIYRKDLADKVRHVSQEVGDGLGYDVLSFFGDGKEKYIEVKSTTVSIDAAFFISRNELGFLNEHKENYFLYRILITNNTPQIKVYNSSEVTEIYEFVPTQYLGRTK